uniref:DUF3560 domain-containing protein n=1 Tax=Nonomuraea sp. CA-252377 TaxID=3240003 RepID=UPI003F499FA0
MITVHVSPAQGIIVTGTSQHQRSLLGSRQRGGLGLRWSDRITHHGRRGAWYEPYSRDRHPSQHRDRAQEIATALQAAGLPTSLDITEQTRPIEQAETDLSERATDRARPYHGFTANAAARAERHLEQAAAATPGYPAGQPILLGSSRQHAHDKAIERHHTHTRQAIEEADRHRYWISRARAAEHLQQHRRDPRATLRRIDRLQQRLRRVERELSGQAHPQFAERDGHIVYGDDGAPLLQWQPATGEYRDRLLLEKSRLSARITYWEDVVAQAAAEGVKIWRPDDFDVGDFALYLGTWYEVIRVNAKSLTVPTGPLEVGRQILRRSDNVDRSGRPSRATGRIPYADVQGHLSSSDAAAQFPSASAG